MRKAAAMWARSASIKTTGIPICALQRVEVFGHIAFFVTEVNNDLRVGGQQRLKVQICLAAIHLAGLGERGKVRGQESNLALTGAALMVTMHSGAIAARIIVATAPLGAMRVISAGSSTVLPRLSVKDTVSGSAGASSSAGDSSVCSGSAVVSSAAGLSVCAVSGAAVSLLAGCATGHETEEHNKGNQKRKDSSVHFRTSYGIVILNIE